MTDQTPLLGERLRIEVERALLRGVKGWQYVRSQGKAGGVCEKTTLLKRGTLTLDHYHPLTDELYRTPILMVMATSNPAYIFDLAPGNSLIEFLLKRGHDIYVIDWSAPTYEERRLTMEDYVLDFIPTCVNLVQEHSGEPDVTLIGYCMGGVLSLMYGALHTPGPMRNLICFTTPFNWSKFGAFNIWADPRYFDVDQLVDTLGNFPPELFTGSVDLLRPANRITDQIRLWDNMWNDDVIGLRRAFEKWGADTLPLAGEYFRQTAKELLFANKLYTGELMLGGRRVDVGEIKVPFLHALAQHDHIVPYEASRELIEKIGSTDKEEVILKGGHVSLVAGGGAIKRLWPKIDSWLGPRST